MSHEKTPQKVLERQERAQASRVSRCRYAAKKKGVGSPAFWKRVVCPASHHRSKEELAKLSPKYVRAEPSAIDEEYLSHGSGSGSGTRGENQMQINNQLQANLQQQPQVDMTALGTTTADEIARAMRSQSQPRTVVDIKRIGNQHR